MDSVWYYLKLIFIGLLSPLIIYFVNDFLFLITLEIFFETSSSILDNLNLPLYAFKIIIYLQTFIIFSLSSVIVLIPIYLYTHLNIKDKKQTIMITTSLFIILFALFIPYISNLFLDDWIIHYSLIPLISVLLTNLYIIFRISKK